MKEQKRKADTRRKIQMGGLVIKAKLDYLHPDNPNILLGILHEAAQKLKTDPTKYEYYYANIGKRAFKETPSINQKQLNA